VDGRGHLGNGDPRPEGQRLVFDAAVVPRYTRMRPVNRQTASLSSARLASSSTETAATGRSGAAARIRSSAPGAASSILVAASIAGRAMSAAATSARTTASVSGGAFTS
jgi:hypothetical protein